MTLICGRISTKKVKVALVVHIPNKHTLSLVQDDRNGSIVVGTVLVLSFNELQRDSGCIQADRACASSITSINDAVNSAYALLPGGGCLSIDGIMPAAGRPNSSLIKLLAYVRAAETTCSNCRTPSHFEVVDLGPQEHASQHCPQSAVQLGHNLCTMAIAYNQSEAP